MSDSFPRTKKFGKETYRFANLSRTKRTAKQTAENIRKRWGWKVRIVHSRKAKTGPSGMGLTEHYAIYEKA